MPTSEEIREEQVRMTKLRLLVDLTARLLGNRSLRRKDALKLIENVRGAALVLFPDKGDVFDLVLRPRFLRILNERALAEWDMNDSLN